MVLLGKGLRVPAIVIAGAFRVAAWVFTARRLWLFFVFLEVVKGVFLCLCFGSDWAFLATVWPLFYVYTQAIRGFLSEFLNFQILLASQLFLDEILLKSAPCSYLSDWSICRLVIFVRRLAVRDPGKALWRFREITVGLIAVFVLKFYKVLKD